MGFTAFFQTPERCQQLFQQLTDPTSDPECLFEILAFLGADFSQKGALSPLQALLTRGSASPFDFSVNPHLFPYAFVQSLHHSPDAALSSLHRSLRVFATSEFDPVSLSIVASSLAKFARKSVFDQRLLRLCLIDCPHRVLRDVFAALVSDDVPLDRLLRLLPLSTATESRSRTSQFFALLKRLKVPPDVVVPFYTDLDQFEASSYSDPDETFIGMLSILEPSETVVR
jgi:hypothetical protein